MRTLIIIQSLPSIPVCHFLTNMHSELKTCLKEMHNQMKLDSKMIWLGNHWKNSPSLYTKYTSTSAGTYHTERCCYAGQFHNSTINCFANQHFWRYDITTQYQQVCNILCKPLIWWTWKRNSYKLYGSNFSQFLYFCKQIK